MKLVFLEIETEKKWALTSAGPGFIASFLGQHHHQADVLRIKPDDALPAIMARIREASPDLLGFSLTAGQWNRARELACHIHTEIRVPVLAGGIFPTFAPEIVLSAKGFDHVCIGEGEHAVLDLISSMENKNTPKKIIENIWSARDGRPQLRVPEKDLDTLPFITRDLLNETHGIVHMFTQRGCPFPCSYCSAGALDTLFKKAYIRRRSVENVIKELRDIKDHAQLNYVVFLDDTFTLNPAWIHEFCIHYPEKINVPFSIQARADTVSPELVFKLSKAGCHHMTFGVESGSPWIRKKVLNRPMTDDQIMNAFAWAKAAGILATANYMIGLPGEKPEHIEMTLALNEKLDPDAFGWAVFHPFPGTMLFDLCLKKGYLPENWHQLPVDDRTSILTLPDLTKDEISLYDEKFKQLQDKNVVQC